MSGNPKYCHKCKAWHSPDDAGWKTGCVSELPATPCSATRWASRDDFVETTLSDGAVMKTGPLTTPEACAFANHLIAEGRWKVSPNAEVRRDAGQRGNA
jgi:hypothetical protein